MAPARGLGSHGAGACGEGVLELVLVAECRIHRLDATAGRPRQLLVLASWNVVMRLPCRQGAGIFAVARGKIALVTLDS